MGLLFFYGLAKFLSICGWKGVIKRRGLITVGRVTASQPIMAQLLPFWSGGCSPYESKSKYVLDVLKSREKTKISLSRSCLPGSRAAKFQSPGDVFANFTASFVPSAPDWESGHVFRPVQSLIRAGLAFRSSSWDLWKPDDSRMVIRTRFSLWKQKPLFSFPCYFFLFLKGNIQSTTVQIVKPHLDKQHAWEAMPAWNPRGAKLWHPGGLSSRPHLASFV